MKILLVGNDPAEGRGLVAFLRTEGHEVQASKDELQALELCQSDSFDLVISDLTSETNALGLLAELRASGISVPVIVTTAHAAQGEAIRAMRVGADDYLTKPLQLDEVSLKVTRIEARQHLMKENLNLRERLRRLEVPEIVGASHVVRDLLQLMRRLADNPDVPVMIFGERGTGKELVARTIHSWSSRQDNPFLEINCAALPDEVLESELFGHGRNTFVSARRDYQGVFQTAQGGTVFFDEVGRMSPHIQTKLLRVLERQRGQPSGSGSVRPWDVRVLGASSRTLQSLVAEGHFREDLYYRLNVVEVHVPPLRERREDIPSLIDYFAEQSATTGKPKLQFSSDAHERLQHYPWPGNVRELENLVRMLSVIADRPKIDVLDLPEKFWSIKENRVDDFDVGRNRDYRSALNEVVADFERRFLTRHLEEERGNISRTAERIGLSRVSLHKKLKEYGIRLKRDSSRPSRARKDSRRKGRGKFPQTSGTSS